MTIRPSLLSLPNPPLHLPRHHERHLFSLYFVLPLLGVFTRFLYHNWYGFVELLLCSFRLTLCWCSSRSSPMRISFVTSLERFFNRGYHPSSLLQGLPVLPPQIFNFLLSCPRLSGLVACTRQCIPIFDPDTSLLHLPVTFEC